MRSNSGQESTSMQQQFVENPFAQPLQFVQEPTSQPVHFNASSFGAAAEESKGQPAGVAVDD